MHFMYNDREVLNGDNDNLHETDGLDDCDDGLCEQAFVAEFLSKTKIGVNYKIFIYQQLSVEVKKVLKHRNSY